MSAALAFNNQMDIYETRRTRLQQLIRESFGNNQAKFSEKTGIKAPQVNRWLSITAEDKRSITEPSARKIENQADKPPRWLDGVDGPTAFVAPLSEKSTAAKEPKASVITLTAPPPTDHPAIAKVLQIMMEMDDPGRWMLAGQAQLIFAQRASETKANPAASSQ